MGTPTLTEEEIALRESVEDGDNDAFPQAVDVPEDELHPTPVLWHSNAPWVGTGYGTQSGLFAPLFSTRLGFRVAFSAFYGLEGSQIGWMAPNGQGYVVYPNGRDPYGNDVLGAHAKHWFRGEGGMVVTLTDPWVLSSDICSRLPLVAWTPVDHEPLMPRTDVWLKESRAIPVAMSRFGAVSLEAAGHTPLYVPHGFDATVFKPPTKEGRARIRAQLGIPQDAFVVGMVAANKGVPSRKCFSEAFLAFARFRERVGRDAVLYLHTRLQEADGENLPALCELCKITPITTDPYLMTLGMKNSTVASIMGIFDVLLNPSQGEGFGCPIMEAQACGTPAITTDFSSMPEVAPVAEGNWLVDGQQPVWTVFESFQRRPDIEQIVEALVEAYEEPEADRLKRRASVHEWVMGEYEAEKVVQKYWRPAMEDAAIAINWRKNKMVHSRR